MNVHGFRSLVVWGLATALAWGVTPVAGQGAPAPATPPLQTESGAAIVSPCLKQTGPSGAALADRPSFRPDLAYTVGWIGVAPDSSTLPASADRTIDQVVKAAEALGPSARVTVIGAVRAARQSEYAVTLSQRLASNAARRLVDRGLRLDDVQTIGLGSALPVSPRAQGVRGRIGGLILFSIGDGAHGPGVQTLAADDALLRLVGELYARYAWEASRYEGPALPLVPFENSSPPVLQGLLSASLRSLLEADLRCARSRGSPCEIEEKVLWGSQDPVACRISIARGAEPDTVALAYQGPSGRWSEVLIKAVQTPAGPRIDDFVHDSGSLRRRLAAQAHGAAPAAVAGPGHSGSKALPSAPVQGR